MSDTSIPPERKRWQKPSVEELGNLRTFVQTGNPGKPGFGDDAEPPVGPSPEMFMPAGG